MRIINLVENESGDSGCEAAHGLLSGDEVQEK